MRRVRGRSGSCGCLRDLGCRAGAGARRRAGVRDAGQRAVPDGPVPGKGAGPARGRRGPRSLPDLAVLLHGRIRTRHGRTRIQTAP
ncbi:hypothetical protein G6F57_020260 [Rhizopus arrhizus]|nr:hypothetical protein G6F57_020260 [Rhizopus arrhizus]